MLDGCADTSARSDLDARIQQRHFGARQRRETHDLRSGGMIRQLAVVTPALTSVIQYSKQHTRAL